jgi:hypothetical protein
LSAGLTGRKVLAPLLGAVLALLLIVAPGASAGNGLRLSMKAKLEGDAIAVQVTGTDKASVAVSGSFHGRAVAGPKKTSVTPGQVGRATLPLAPALKRQLAKTPRGQKLVVVIEAKGRNAAGVKVTVSVELELPGRKKSARGADHGPSNHS